MKKTQMISVGLLKTTRALRTLSFVSLMLLCIAPGVAVATSSSNGITGPSDALFRAGLWWDPARNGSGWEINQSGESVFGIWYTYNPAGEPVWYTTNGPLNDNGYEGDLLSFTWDYDNQQVNTHTVAGHVSIQFLNPQLAEINWQLGVQQGQQILRPFIFSAHPTLADYSGSWFDWLEPGYGLTIQTQGDQTYAVVYYYDKAGIPTWSAGINAQGEQVLSMLNFNGSCPSCEYNLPTYVPAGELLPEFHSEIRLGLQMTLPDAAPFWTKSQAQHVMISNPPSGRAHPAAMAQITSEDALAYYYKSGYMQGNGYVYPVMLCLPPIVSPAPPAPPPPSSEAISSTNVQVAGVDEADVVKATRQFLYSVNFSSNEISRTWDHDATQQSITRYRISADGETPVGDGMFPISLPRLENSHSFVQSQGLYHFEPVTDFGTSKLIYLASQVEGGCYMPSRGSTSIRAFNSEANTDFEPVAQLEIDGELIASRQIGDRLFIATIHRPDIYQLAEKVLSPELASQFVPTPDNVEALFNFVTPAQLFPTVSYADGSQLPLVATENVMMPSLPIYDIKPVLTTLSMFDLNDLSIPPVSISIMGRSNGMYATPQSVYLASSHKGYGLDQAGELVRTGFIDTDIHKIAIELDALEYRGSASVAGSLGHEAERLAFRMSEHDGYLRVVSHSNWNDRWGEWGNNRLTILKDLEGDNLLLDTISVLPNALRPEPIGKPNENIHGVRFHGTRAYIVTFVKVDPLYSLDLSDPEDPLVLGELEIEGFSDYLHPIGDNLLLGIGLQAKFEEESGTTWFQGVQVGLFDVSAPTDPVLLNLHEIGQRGTNTAVMDTHRAFTSLPADAETGQPMRIVIPISEHGPPDGVLDPRPNHTYPWLSTGIVMFEVDEKTNESSTLKQTARANVASIDSTDPDDVNFYRYPDSEHSRSVIYGDQVFHYFRGGLFMTPWAGSDFTPADNCPLCLPTSERENP